MSKFMRRSFEICLIVVSYCCASANIAKAQVTPDNRADDDLIGLRVTDNAPLLSRLSLLSHVDGTNGRMGYHKSMTYS